MSDLSPLAGLGSLQQINCSGTQVSDLSPLAGLGNLQRVDCSFTQVSDLSPLTGLGNLQQVDCSFTQVSDLSPLTGLDNLQQVTCSHTQVSDLSPLAGLGNLRQINCSGTQVSDLSPLASIGNLQQVDCSFTQVSDLSPLAGLGSLQRVDCSHTQVSDLSPLPDLDNLQQFTCNDTLVSDLSPLAGLGNLQQVDCSFTQVSDLSPLTGLDNLQQVTCSHTQVSDLSPLAGLGNLQQVTCSGTQVSDLSPLAGVGNLQQVTCSGTQVSDLSPLAGLGNLQQVNCSRTQVSDLSPLAGLGNLQQVTCSVTLVSDLSPLTGLDKLQEVTCSRTQVSDLSPLVGLSNLQQIDCSRTQVGDLSPLAGLGDLQQVTCSGTRVSDLSPLASISNLQQVTFIRTQVSDLSPLAGLDELHQVDCSGTQVSDLSPLAGLGNLQQVNCSSTQVSDLSPLAGLEKLQQIDCSDTQVSDLSPLTGLEKLQQIDCSRTQVSDLSPLTGLEKLRRVDCSDTQVSDLSPLAECYFLYFIRCNFCRLSSINNSILYKKSLLFIEAEGCYIPEIPHGLFEKGNCLPGLRAHFDDLAQGTANLPDAKLLILGNGGAGKTQIARWLSGEPFDPEWDSTHGIRVVGQPRDGSLAAEFHLQIWDFGGQDIYHGTHALFLRGPAILMPVWTKSRENRETYTRDGLTFRNHPLAYWLDVVRHQASPGNPVLIVQSQCDHPSDEERRFPIPPETLAALPSVSELRLSAKVPRGSGALKDALTDATMMLRDPSRFGMPQIGVGRLRVIRRLEALRDADMALPAAERKHRLLTRAAYEAICAEEGGVSSPDLLLEFLHASGTVFYRAGLFEDSIILDQGWALDKIYAVFDRKQAYKELQIDGGRFTRRKLGFYVWKDQRKDEQELLISMMRSCGICFLYRKIVDEDGAVDEYIAPDLLPRRDAVADQLSSRWDDERSSESATFSYGLLHGGLIRSIMSEIGEVAGCDGLYWRGGFCAYEATTRSRFLIEEEMTGEWEGRIRVRTQSGQADLLLQRLVALIEKVQDRLAMRATDVDQTIRAPVAPPHEPEKLTIVQEKPAMPEWYVSYAWGDDKTPEGRQRAEIVDKLCAAAEAKGHKILRDRNVLNLGDSISAFMRRIGAGDQVFVILSDKYLRSPNCMFELSEIWRTSRQEGPAFLERVRVYALPDAKIWQPVDWADWAIHWKQEHDALQSRAVQYGVGILGETGGRKLRQMQAFSLSVSDILGTLTDIVQPRTFEELERYGLDDTPAAGPT